MSKMRYISVSQLLKYQGCSWSWKLSYIDRLQGNIKSYSLIYGSIMHSVIEMLLIADVNGQTINGPQIFRALWNKACQDHEIQFPKTKSAEDILALGMFQAGQFMEKWDAFGIEPLIDSNGSPMLEVGAKVQISDTVVLVGFMDFMGRTTSGKNVVIDWKTPAAITPPWYVKESPQLTLYRLLGDQALKDAGIEGQVDEVALVELEKKNLSKTARGTDPLIHIERAPRPSDEALNNVLAAIHNMDANIRDERFTKDVGHAFNSMCGFCDFKDYCLNGDITTVSDKPKFRRSG